MYVTGDGQSTYRLTKQIKVSLIKVMTNRMILSISLLLYTCRPAQGNLFRRKDRKIRLNAEFERVKGEIFNKEMWKQMEQNIRAIMISRDGEFDNSRGESKICSSPSSSYLEQQVSNIGSEDLNKVFEWNLYALPFVYKLYIMKPISSQEYFGLDGQYTTKIIDAYGAAQKFWLGSGLADQIFLVGAHGSDLADRNKLIPTLEFLFEGSYDNEYTANDHANEIESLIQRLPKGYNFPLLTFNAFAMDTMDDNGPTIIFGDGYFDFQKSISLDLEGPEFAVTHELSHHLHYALGISDSDIKKQELMADAFSAYFLSHDRGRDMARNEISNIQRLAYSIGDCDTENPMHHGTPQERKCATIWGASIANSQGGKQLGALELTNRFDAWFNRINELNESCEFISSIGYLRSQNIGLNVLR